MTTHSFSSAISMASDALYRAWWDEVRAGLAACGLVQTADTGQLNPATHVRPGANQTASGYEIWRFDDALQATAPIYLKIEPGRFNSLTTPWCALTVGSGTNGAGTLTGIVTDRFAITAGSSGPGGGSYASYFCHTEGFAGAVFKASSITSGVTFAVFGFMVIRTVDSAGDPTADGCVVYRTNNSSAPAHVTVLRFAATAQAFATDQVGRSTVIPTGISDTTVGADKQVFQHLMAIPRVVPVFGCCTYLTGEYSAGSTISVAMVGVTARTYLCLGNNMGLGDRSTTPSAGIAMLWE